MSVGEKPKDVSAAYRFWDELIQANVRLALAPRGEGPEERRAAEERFKEGWKRSLMERDAVLPRLIRCLEKTARDS